uniref:ATP synthase F0 subunit 8 n=1 Tax=Calantica studeri TaxID=2977347 RepID=UPI0021CD0603|nr:ATP synthase F0 subunit 8 [Calantica studeri]UWM12859.1 ATP synthase F0 subunit 8 [Calantica studeri]
MPHMSPIMWAPIFIMTLLSLMILLCILYFNSIPLSTDHFEKSRVSFLLKWPW